MRAVNNASHILELNRRFHDDVEAATYDQRMGVCYSAEAVASSIDELERVLGRPLPPGGTIVDVGAGTGNLAVKLALDGRFDRVIAVDISAGMLGEASRSAEAHNVVLETIANDMVRLPFADGSIDVVVGCAVLHHLPDPQAFLQEVRRVTHAVKLPLLAAVRAARTFGLLPQPVWEHEAIDVHTFTPSDVQAMANGFVDMRFVPEGFCAPVVDQGLLAPLALIGGRLPGVRATADFVRDALRRLDTVVAPMTPTGWRASVKFSCAAPVLG